MPARHTSVKDWHIAREIAAHRKSAARVERKTTISRWRDENEGHVSDPCQRGRAHAANRSEKCTRLVLRLLPLELGNAIVDDASARLH